MSRLIDTPVGFLRGEVLTEYVRQTYHLLSGTEGDRGLDRAGGGSLALWCRRRNRRLTTMQCAVFPGEGDETARLIAAIGDILRRGGPDAATIRVMHRPGEGALGEGGAMPARLRIAGRYLLLSLGADLSVELLPLGSDFNAFLGRLGKKTRSHARSSLRTFEREGYRCRFDSPIRLETTPEIALLSSRNMPYAPPPERLGEHTDYLNAQATPFQSTLSAPDGAIISIIRGYLIDGHAALIDQINPENHPKIGQAGPSLLHRALLIRVLIEKGVEGLIVAGGCGGMLTRYCRPVAFNSYLALPFNPVSWLRCLRHAAGNPAMGRWAIGRFFGG